MFLSNTPRNTSELEIRGHGNLTLKTKKLIFAYILLIADLNSLFLHLWKAFFPLYPTYLIYPIFIFFSDAWGRCCASCEQCVSVWGAITLHGKNTHYLTFRHFLFILMKNSFLSLAELYLSYTINLSISILLLHTPCLTQKGEVLTELHSSVKPVCSCHIWPPSKYGNLKLF